MTLLQITQATGFPEISISFITRFVINVCSAFILIRYIYFPIYKNRETVFLFSVFNILIFTITYLLNSVDIGMGSAFGLFAVFHMLQYRTVKISAKDMTYLFLLIAIGLIDAVGITSWQVLSILSLSLLGLTYLLESSVLLKREASQIITYTNLNFIRADKRHNLIADLEFRLGFKITHLSVKEINFEKGTALIHICYAYSKKDKAVNNDKPAEPPITNGTAKINTYTIVEKPKPLKEYVLQEVMPHKTKGKNKEKNIEHIEEHIPESRDKKTGKKNNGYLRISNNLNL